MLPDTECTEEGERNKSKSLPALFPLPVRSVCVSGVEKEISLFGHSPEYAPDFFYVYLKAFLFWEEDSKHVHFAKTEPCHRWSDKHEQCSLAQPAASKE